MDWKSEGLPKKSQRSVFSFVPLMLFTCVVDGPGLWTLQRHDCIDLPAFQELQGNSRSRQRVGYRQGETMPHVIVATRIFAFGMRAVLREELILIR